MDGTMWAGIFELHGSAYMHKIKRFYVLLALHYAYFIWSMLCVVAMAIVEFK